VDTNSLFRLLQLIGTEGVAEYSSSLSQVKRSEIVARFRAGELKMYVCHKEYCWRAGVVLLYMCYSHVAIA
jgi:Lhr-like helicase